MSTHIAVTLSPRRAECSYDIGEGGDVGHETMLSVKNGAPIASSPLFPTVEVLFPSVQSLACYLERLQGEQVIFS